MSESILFESTFDEELYQFSTPVAVVLDVPWNELSESEVELLSKILTSVKLSLAAVRIVHAKELDLSQWTEKPSKLIGFGVKRSGIPSYEVIETPSTKLLLSDRLSILNAEDDLKKRLWISLKQLFFATPPA